MITMYTSPGCASCRKAKQWLTEQGISFRERNIFAAILKDEEIKSLLMKSENGTDDIISRRSKIIIDNNINVEEMTMGQLVDFIRENPSILKRPIIVDENHFVVGYDDDEITTFIPSELRRITTTHCNGSCASFKRCGETREMKEAYAINVE